MKKNFNELLSNYKEGSIKAFRIHENEENELVDVLTLDGEIYKDIDYSEHTAPVLIAMITEETLIYDERPCKTFDEIVKETKKSNKQMYKQFEDLCNQNNIDFNFIKSVLDSQYNKNKKQKYTQDLGRYVCNSEESNSKPRSLELKFSGTPDEIREQMTNTLKEHPEYKDILRLDRYPFNFCGFFPF